jgi:hypothetical protein
MTTPSTLKSGRIVDSKRNRRRFPRYRLDVLLRLNVLHDNQYLHTMGRTSDLAHGGLGCVLPMELQPDEVVNLELCLPEIGEPLLLRAVVRYRRGLSYGLEFLGPTVDQQQQIDLACAGLVLVQ